MEESNDELTKTKSHNGKLKDLINELDEQLEAKDKETVRLVEWHTYNN